MFFYGKNGKIAGSQMSNKLGAKPANLQRTQNMKPFEQQRD